MKRNPSTTRTTIPTRRCSPQASAPKAAMTTNGCGVCSTQRIASIIASSRSEIQSKTTTPLASSQSKARAAASPTGILFSVSQSTEVPGLHPGKNTSGGECAGGTGGAESPPPCPLEERASSHSERGLHGFRGIAAILRRHALDPADRHFGVLREPGHGRVARVFPVVEDRRHDLVFHSEAEPEVLEERAKVGALLREPRRGVGVDRCPAEIGAEPVVAAGEVAYVEIGVHRVGFPAEKHHRFVATVGAFDLGEHALFGAFGDVETAETEGVVVDHRLA